MTMHILNIKAGQPALLTRALDHLIKGLMLNRANALEDREAATAAVDQAVALKRAIGEIDEDVGATLITGGQPVFPGISEINHACDELFGVGNTPEILADAIQAHTASLAVGLAAAMIAGTRARAMAEASRALLEEYGGNVPDWLLPAATEVQEALDNLDAMDAPEAFTPDVMEEAVTDIYRTAPQYSAWIASVRASWEPKPAPLTVDECAYEGNA